jgi:hypothetical protein
VQSEPCPENGQTPVLVFKEEEAETEDSTYVTVDDSWNIEAGLLICLTIQFVYIYILTCLSRKVGTSYRNHSTARAPAKAAAPQSTPAYYSLECTGRLADHVEANSNGVSLGKPYPGLSARDDSWNVQAGLRRSDGVWQVS